MPAKIYPWEEWLNRKRRFAIEKGKHFHCEIHGMIQQIRNAACKSRKHVTVKVDGSRIWITNGG